MPMSSKEIIEKISKNEIDSVITAIKNREYGPEAADPSSYPDAFTPFHALSYIIINTEDEERKASELICCLKGLFSDSLEAALGIDCSGITPIAIILDEDGYKMAGLILENTTCDISYKSEKFDELKRAVDNDKEKLVCEIIRRADQLELIFSKIMTLFKGDDARYHLVKKSALIRIKETRDLEFNDALQSCLFSLLELEPSDVIEFIEGSVNEECKNQAYLYVLSHTEDESIQNNILLKLIKPQSLSDIYFRNALKNLTELNIVGAIILIQKLEILTGEVQLDVFDLVLRFAKKEYSIMQQLFLIGFFKNQIAKFLMSGDTLSDTTLQERLNFVIQEKTEGTDFLRSIAKIDAQGNQTDIITHAIYDHSNLFSFLSNHFDSFQEECLEALRRSLEATERLPRYNLTLVQNAVLKGIDINAAMFGGKTLLHFFIEKRNERAISILRECGAFVDGKMLESVVLNDDADTLKETLKFSSDIIAVVHDESKDGCAIVSKRFGNTAVINFSGKEYFIYVFSKGEWIYRELKEALTYDMEVVRRDTVGCILSLGDMDRSLYGGVKSIVSNCHTAPEYFDLNEAHIKKLVELAASKNKSHALNVFLINAKDNEASACCNFLMVAIENDSWDAVKIILKRMLPAQEEFIISLLNGSLPSDKKLKFLECIEVSAKIKLFKDKDPGVLISVLKSNEEMPFFQSLFDCGTDENLISKNRHKILIDAFSSVSENILLFLLEKLSDADENGDTILHSAVLAKSPDLVKWLIGKGFNDAKNKNGYSALFLAAQSGETDLFEPLIEGAAEFQGGADIYNPLFAAIRHQVFNSKIVRALIEKKYAMYSSSLKRDLLENIIRRVPEGYFDVFKVLCEDSTIDIEGFCGELTILQYAVQYNRKDIVEHLISCGAEKHRKVREFFWVFVYEGNDSRKLLDAAKHKSEANGGLPILVLLKNQKDKVFALKSGENELRCIEDMSDAQKIKEKFGHYGAEGGVVYLSTCLDFYKTLNKYIDFHGEHVLFSSSFSAIIMEIQKIFLDNPAYENIGFFIRYRKETALYLIESNPVCCEFKDSEGNTPLHIAASLPGCEDILKALLEKEGLTLEKNNLGFTALDIAFKASYKKHTDVALDIFRKFPGAAHTIPDNVKNILFQSAVVSRYFDCMSVLVDSGAKIRRLDDIFDNAISSEDREMLDFLIGKFPAHLEINEKCVSLIKDGKIKDLLFFLSYLPDAKMVSHDIVFSGLRIGLKSDLFLKLAGLILSKGGHAPLEDSSLHKIEDFDRLFGLVKTSSVQGSAANSVEFNLITLLMADIEKSVSVRKVAPAAVATSVAPAEVSTPVVPAAEPPVVPAAVETPVVPAAVSTPVVPAAVSTPVETPVVPAAVETPVVPAAVSTPVVPAAVSTSVELDAGQLPSGGSPANENSTSPIIYASEPLKSEIPRELFPPLPLPSVDRLAESSLERFGRGIRLALVTLGAIVAGAVLYPLAGVIWLGSMGFVITPLRAIEDQRTSLLAQWGELIGPDADPVISTDEINASNTVSLTFDQENPVDEKHSEKHSDALSLGNLKNNDETLEIKNGCGL